MVAKLRAEIEQNSPGIFKCLVQDEFRSNPQHKAQVQDFSVKLEPVSPSVSVKLQPVPQSLPPGNEQLNGGRGRGPTSSECRRNVSSIEHVACMSQDIDSVDCGPMMVQNIRNYIFGQTFEDMPATEARMRQTLAILDADVRFLETLEPLSADSVARAAKAWTKGYKDRYARPGSGVTWEAIASLKPGNLVSEECIDDLCQLIEPQGRKQGIVIMSVALLDQVRADEQGMDPLYTRSSKFLRPGPIEKFIVPIEGSKHYFCAVVHVDGSSRPVLPMVVLDSASGSDLVTDRPAFHSLWRFLQSNCDRNMRHASLVKEQSHARHANAFDIPEFVFARIGSRVVGHNGNAGNASSFTLAEVTAMLKSASHYNRMPGVSGTDLRESLMHSLSVSLDQTLTEAIRTRLTCMDGVKHDVDEKEVLTEYNRLMAPCAIPRQFGGDFELYHLTKVLKAPIIVFQFETILGQEDSTSEFSVVFAHGLDQPNLPIFLGLMNPQSRYGCHYALLMPFELPEFAVSMEAAEHLVYVHAHRVVVRLGDLLVQMAIFGVTGDGDCLFTALRLADLSRQECFQRGGTKFPSLFRHKDLESQHFEALKLFNSMGHSKGTIRQIRKLVDTQNGDHAYDTTLLSSVLKKVLIAQDFLVGPYHPFSVSADLGVGLGATVLVQYIVSGPGSIAIGTEVDEVVHRQFLSIQEHLINQGCPGQVATRKIEALDAGPFDGVHYVDLYDGQRSVSDQLRRPREVDKNTQT